MLQFQSPGSKFNFKMSDCSNALDKIKEEIVSESEEGEDSSSDGSDSDESIKNEVNQVREDIFNSVNHVPIKTEVVSVIDTIAEEVVTTETVYVKEEKVDVNNEESTEGPSRSER